MVEELVYISRKKKLLKEIDALASFSLSLGFKKFCFSAALKISSILAKFDLGDQVDDEATSFLETLEQELEKEKPDEQLVYDGFVKLICLLHESVSAVRDFS